MSSLGWLDVTDIPFNALLLLEPIHVRYLAQRQPSAEMGTALKANPVVRWYLEQIYPPITAHIQACLALDRDTPTPQERRAAELGILDGMQDWLIYVLDPEQYDRLEFLGWDDDSLLSMADFKDKVVIDVGSGTGRLAFTVAPLAKVVYAVEPVANLRRYLWAKREQLGLTNVYPVDGTITQLPFPGNFTDILMGGHVFGDDPQAEYYEMRRVVRGSGLILLHPGTSALSEDQAHHFLVENGFQFDVFEEPRDGMKRKYWQTINK